MTSDHAVTTAQAIYVGLMVGIFAIGYMWGYRDGSKQPTTVSAPKEGG